MCCRLCVRCCYHHTTASGSRCPGCRCTTNDTDVFSSFSDAHDVVCGVIFVVDVVNYKQPAGVIFAWKSYSSPNTAARHACGGVFVILLAAGTRDVDDYRSELAAEKAYQPTYKRRFYSSETLPCRFSLICCGRHTRRTRALQPLGALPPLCLLQDLAAKFSPAFIRFSSVPVSSLQVSVTYPSASTKCKYKHS